MWQCAPETNDMVAAEALHVEFTGRWKNILWACFFSPHPAAYFLAEQELIQNSCEKHFINFYSNRWLPLWKRHGGDERQTFLSPNSRDVSIAIHSTDQKKNILDQSGRSKKTIKFTSAHESFVHVKLKTLKLKRNISSRSGSSFHATRCSL